MTPEFRLMHVGINCGCDRRAEETARLFEDVFGLSYTDKGSLFTLHDAIEIVKDAGHGEKGHIALKTPDLDAAIRYITDRGYEFDEDSRMGPPGKTMSIYLKQDFAGFAVHIVEASE